MQVLFFLVDSVVGVQFSDTICILYDQFWKLINIK